ncbi:MAG: hypothetical protein ACE5I1_02000 [bacterium]
MQTESPEILNSDTIESYPAEIANDTLTIQNIKNEMAIRLLKTWLADDSGYDEKNWQRIKQVIEENKLSSRSKFNG